MSLGVAGLLGFAYKTKTTVNVWNAFNDSRFDPAVDLISGFAARQLLVVPVPDRHGSVIGLIQILNRNSKSDNSVCFDEEDVAIVENLAHAASIVLGRESLAEATMIAQQRAQSILTVTEHMKRVALESNSESFSSVIQNALSVIEKLIPADSKQMLVKDKVTGELWPIPKTPLSSKIRHTDGDICSEVLKGGNMVIINDVTQDPRFDPIRDQQLSLETVHSIALVPVKDQIGECIGLIQVSLMAIVELRANA